MSYRDIPHDDFQAGFEVGYRAIKGNAGAVPATWAFGKDSNAPAWSCVDHHCRFHVKNGACRM
jgi:hypothetical protein